MAQMDNPLLAIGPARPGPALRRGFLVAIPVGVALFLEFGLDSPTKGAIATGALLAGFVALDAPARVRAAWQTVAPLVGIAAALGVLTGSSPVLAIPAIAVVGAAAGYCFSVSLRLSIAGLSIALSMVIAQGLPLDASDALGALLLTTAGGLMQPLFSILIWSAGDRSEEGRAEAWSTSAARARLRGNLTLASVNARHALRFGSALAIGVAAYWLLDMEDHGFWIPLTILFVLRPQRDETFRRLVLRALGTAAGLIVASLLSEWLQSDAIALALVLTLATGFAYGLLTVQYALFTMAITVYAVVLADTLGEPTLEAAGQRGLATAIGIGIAFLSFLVWSNPAASQPRGANR
jgi:hypothetical protein